MLSTTLQEQQERLEDRFPVAETVVGRPSTVDEIKIGKLEILI